MDIENEPLLRPQTRKKLITVQDRIFWSYSNLAMATAAVTNKSDKNLAIRGAMFVGLTNGTKHIKSFFDDEKSKLQTGQLCNYCGSKEKLSIDHILPKKLGGTDDAENLIYACQFCNSSKGKKDLME